VQFVGVRQRPRLPRQVPQPTQKVWTAALNPDDRPLPPIEHSLELIVRPRPHVQMAGYLDRPGGQREGDAVRRYQRGELYVPSAPAQVVVVLNATARQVSDHVAKFA